MNEQPGESVEVTALVVPRRRRRVMSTAAAALAVMAAGGIVFAGAAEQAARVVTPTILAANPLGASHGGRSLSTGTAPTAATSGGSIFHGAGQKPRRSETGGVGAPRPATAAEQTGVVDVTTVLDYGAGRAAGTGIVLTGSGEILTNNHVIDQATAITVTVTATGARYPAVVVGTDRIDDVAVLQLRGASGLTTAPLASAAQQSALAVGDPVVAVGNAGGTGGTPTASPGSVIGLRQTITASDDNGANPERLHGLIAVDAAIRPGDSGGPLEAGGTVVGIDTAAGFRTGSRAQTGSAGFAIPLSTATAIAGRIVAGASSAAVHLGGAAFLGVQVDASDGTEIVGVVPGSPAAAAGLARGDTITAVDGVAVDGGSALSAALRAHQPADRVRVTWTDTAGHPHTATVALTTGPAD